MALLEFYGETCPHCIKMTPLVERLKKEEGIKIEKLEVWNNQKNADRQNKYDTGLCGGVPFFYDTESKEFICGDVDYNTLLSWAKRNA